MVAPFQNVASAVDTSPPTRRRVVVARLTLWILFGVIIGLMPLVFDTLRATLSVQGFSVITTLARGQLFISSAAMSAGAMGELFFSSSARRGDILQVIAGFFCLLCCLANSVAYTQVPVAQPAAIVTLSLIFFPLTILASGICIGMTAGR